MAQVYRDPHFETFRWIFVDKEGVSAMQEDLGHGLTPDEEAVMLRAFACTLERRLQHTFWTIRWHKKRGRPLPPFPELFRIRDEAERRMWNTLRRTHFRLIQGGKKG